MMVSSAHGEYGLQEKLQSCAGAVFIKVYRLGCIVTVRGGKGVLLKRKSDGSWSAPVGLNIMGPAVGASIGFEKSNFIILLKSEAQVNAFCSPNGVSMGLNGAFTIGTLGLSAEAFIGSDNTEGCVVVCSSKGIYGGVSLEFSLITVDSKANRCLYDDSMDAKHILESQPVPEGEIFARMYRFLNGKYNKSPDTTMKLEEGKIVNLDDDNIVKADYVTNALPEEQVMR